MSYRPDPLPSFIKTLYNDQVDGRRSEATIRSRPKADAFKISRFGNLSTSGEIRKKNKRSRETGRIAQRISSELSLQDKVGADTGLGKTMTQIEDKKETSALIDRQLDRIKFKLRSGLPITNKAIADVISALLRHQSFQICTIN